MADTPASVDFNQFYAKFAGVLPFCNTTDALSLSSVKFFCALQAVLCLLISLSFIIAAMIVRHRCVTTKSIILHPLAKTIIWGVTQN